MGGRSTRRRWPVAVDDRQLGELGQRVAVGGRLDGRGEVGPCPLVDVFIDLGHVDVGVVDVEGAHVRVGMHALAIGSDRDVGGALALVLGEPTSPGGNDAARCQTLDVPLERASKRLVEVVHVEQQVALRRGEEAEVREVGVAAELDIQAAVRMTGQVRTHGQGRATIERRRRDCHPAVPDGDQLGDARRRLLGDEVDRICPSIATLARRPGPQRALARARPDPPRQARLDLPAAAGSVPRLGVGRTMRSWPSLRRWADVPPIVPGDDLS